MRNIVVFLIVAISILLILLTLAFLILLNSCAREPDVANLGSSGKNIICFGNSLTSGEGAGVGEDYPSYLAQGLPGWVVLNKGRSGDTTRTALERLEEDVLSQDPFIVIVELGGNDFLLSVSPEETFKNLTEIVVRIQSKGIMVVIVGLETGILRSPGKYVSGYRKLAKSHHTAFVPDILGGILGHPDLMSDEIHPNSKGYSVMAGKILPVVRRLIEKSHPI